MILHLQPAPEHNPVAAAREIAGFRFHPISSPLVPQQSSRTKRMAPTILFGRNHKHLHDRGIRFGLAGC